MSDSILQLYPRDPGVAPQDLSTLVCALRTIAFIGTAIDYCGAVHYDPGAQFPHLIRFAAWHTVVLLEPHEGRLVEAGRRDSAQLCHIGMGKIFPEAEFLGMGNTRTPRCPDCNRTVSNWPVAMDSWYASKPTYRWQCPGCGRQSAPAAWDWRKTAAIARFSIEVWGIRHGEARPAPTLLRFLAEQTASPWDYFYWHC
ncbi:MAG TPA: hypothetical protein VM536_02695 [Chloroflexia bacterium]|nr:hypothetical protein [Chloroflexia bacterium]